MKKEREVGLNQPFLGGRPIGQPIVAKNLDQVTQRIALAAFLSANPANGAVVADDRVV